MPPSRHDTLPYLWMPVAQERYQSADRYPWVRCSRQLSNRGGLPDAGPQRSNSSGDLPTPPSLRHPPHVRTQPRGKRAFSRFDDPWEISLLRQSRGQFSLTIRALREKRSVCGSVPLGNGDNPRTARKALRLRFCDTRRPLACHSRLVPVESIWRGCDNRASTKVNSTCNRTKSQTGWELSIMSPKLFCVIKQRARRKLNGV